MSDTGLTGMLWKKKIEETGPSDVVFTMLYRKPHSEFVPDYHVLETDKWVVFPGEEIETMEKLSCMGDCDSINKYFTKSEIHRYKQMTSMLKPSSQVR